MSKTPPPQPDILSVSALTGQIKAHLEEGIGEVWLTGEVSNLRQQSSGHCYFSLKDEGAQISAVLFRGDLARQHVALANGIQLVVYGRISVYEPRGNYQIVVRMAMEAGAGQLQQRFEALKKKLGAEGLFDAERKRPIPRLPETIGVITSPTGAAVRDFLSILRRRCWSGRVIILPARVQGDRAAEEIAAQIEQACALGNLDLLVLTRGGGSLEDLWPFNEEVVVRAIASCSLPVLSAVGHEIDFSLSDFAADKRAETPSAAAEYITASHRALLERLHRVRRAFYPLVEHQVRMERNRFSLLQHRLATHSPERRIENAHLRLDDLAGRLRTALRDRLTQHRQEWHEAMRRYLQASPQGRIEVARERLRQLQFRLRAASPQSIQERGFVIVRDQKGRVVTRREGLRKGQPLRAGFSDGVIDVHVSTGQMELF